MIGSGPVEPGTYQAETSFFNGNCPNQYCVPASAQSTFDPLWGQVGPAAGDWFGAQALQLVADANQSASLPGNRAPAP